MSFENTFIQLLQANSIEFIINGYLHSKIVTVSIAFCKLYLC